MNNLIVKKKKEMNQDKTNRKLIWLLDELITNVVNSTDVDIEARRKIR